MTTITVETKITYKYLMSKSKDWLATEYLRLLDQLDKEQKHTEQLEKLLDLYDIDESEASVIDCEHPAEYLHESVYDEGTFICKNCGAAIRKDDKYS